MARNSVSTIADDTPAPEARVDEPSAPPALRQLRVTTFESLMLAQDSPSHPMTAQLEASYSGSLQRSLFEETLARTLARHPLLRARIDSRQRPRRWTVCQDEHPFLDWNDLDAPLAFPNGTEFIDLRRDIGIRVWVRAGSERGRMVFQFHHACTDGTGVLAFFMDVLRTHAALAHGDRHFAPPRDSSALERRDQFHAHPIRARLRALLGATMHGPRWRRMRPAPLGGRIASPTVRPMGSVLHLALASPVFEGLLARARANGATLNDLLLRDLFRVLARDCRRPDHSPVNESPVAGDQSQRDCLVICMPVNLRTTGDETMPAANKLMLTFLHRSPEECTDARSLLGSLNAETTTIKTTRRGLKILEVLRLAIGVTGRIPDGLLKKTSFATAVLTNLGRLDALADGLAVDERGRLLSGGLTIERIVTAPNGQPGTHAVFVAATYAGRLTIAIHHDPRALSRREAERLLTAYLDQLRSTAGETG